MTDTGSKILNYLEDEALVDIANIRMDQNLLADGFIDSYGFIEMITFLERECGCKLTDEDIQNPGVTSVNGLIAIIDARVGKAA